MRKPSKTKTNDLEPQWMALKRPALYFCVTDKEIFDVLMSSRQRLTDAVLLGLARERGIFYSAHDSRDMLAANMALLTYDYHDLSNVLQHREQVSRAEKVTSITLNASLTVDDIKEVVSELVVDTPSDETIVGHKRGSQGYVMDVSYSEVDFGKTRLAQRKPKEAAIEFVVSGDKTLIRLPANSKAKEIVEKVKARLEERKRITIAADMIDVSDIIDPGLRTQFFTTLISTLPQYSLYNVTSVKVGRLPEDGNGDNDESEDAETDGESDPEADQAAAGMLAVVTDVVMKGTSLLTSAEYRSLRDRGFFITSIVWRARLMVPDYPIVEFEAGFEEPGAGRGFKYNTRGVFPCKAGKYTKHIKALSDTEKQTLLAALEQTAARALQHIRDAAATRQEGSVEAP